MSSRKAVSVHNRTEKMRINTDFGAFFCEQEALVDRWVKPFAPSK
jgi:hypothetical protein